MAPANIESMMFVGETPWHGVGKELPKEAPANEAIVAAGLDWKVTKEPLFVEQGAGQGLNAAVKVPNFRAIVRSSDKSILSVQSKDYTPFQNDEMFAFAEALVGSKRARFHTAGSLAGGRRVWALMKTDRLIEVTSRDSVEAYILLANSHDGSLAFRAAFTSVRVVCQNTLNAALQGVTQCLSVRHTGKLQDRVAEAQKVLGVGDGYFGAFEAVSKKLVATPFTDKQMEKLSTDLFQPVRIDPETGDAEVNDSAKANADKVVELFTTGLGHQERGLVGTAWAAYNAVAEYTDHHAKARATDRGSQKENRLNSIFFGNAAALKQKSLSLIGSMTNVQLAA